MEKERFCYAIRLKGNNLLQLKIEHLTLPDPWGVLRTNQRCCTNRSCIRPQAGINLAVWSLKWNGILANCFPESVLSWRIWIGDPRRLFNFTTNGKQLSNWSRKPKSLWRGPGFSWQRSPLATVCFSLQPWKLFTAVGVTTENRTLDLDYSSGDVDWNRRGGNQTCPIYYVSIGWGCHSQKAGWIHVAKDRSFADFSGNGVKKAPEEKVVCPSEERKACLKNPNYWRFFISMAFGWSEVRFMAESEADSGQFFGFKRRFTQFKAHFKEW